MGCFDYLRAGGVAAIKPQVPTVRTELVKAKKNPFEHLIEKPNLIPIHLAGAKSRQAARTASRAAAKSRTATPKKRSSGTPATKNSTRRGKVTPKASRLSSDSDDDDEVKPPPKRRRSATAGKETSPGRMLRAASDPSQAMEDTAFVHAADVASTNLSDKYAATFAGASENFIVALQYPSKEPTERFELARPRDGEDFDPTAELVAITEVVSKYYMDKSDAVRFGDESAEMHRKLKRAVIRKSPMELLEAVDVYNTAIRAALDRGIIARKMKTMHELPLELVEMILTQIYARSISPNVTSLREYQAGTDNVYGELLPRFVSKIFHETGLTENKVFVDLGSGVGNVVLQAALEIGCESWGCEIMNNACKLASMQYKEFVARCRLWNLTTGAVHLEQGDFFGNRAITKILKKADVVLINNQAFTPELNDRLTNFFYDLKEGCQVVSLKSFVPPGHRMKHYNMNSPLNLLEVTQKSYFSDCVSWTNAPGNYFIAKKDSTASKAFFAKTSAPLTRVTQKRKRT